MKKNNEQQEKYYTTLDAYQSGFLTLRGHCPKLVDQNGKIIFVFTVADNFLKDLTDYSSGAMVEAFRLASAVKTLKSQIHSLRGEKKMLIVREKSTKLTPLKAIRSKCIDCSGGVIQDVRECPFDGVHDEFCPLFPLRMGKGSRKTLKAIRSYCLWCCSGQRDEIRHCPATGCPLLAYRFGHRPHKSIPVLKNSLTAGVLDAEVQKR